MLPSIRVCVLSSACSPLCAEMNDQGESQTNYQGISHGVCVDAKSPGKLTPKVLLCLKRKRLTLPAECTAEVVRIMREEARDMTLDTAVYKSCLIDVVRGSLVDVVGGGVGRYCVLPGRPWPSCLSLRVLTLIPNPISTVPSHPIPSNRIQSPPIPPHPIPSSPVPSHSAPCHGIT